MRHADLALKGELRDEAKTETRLSRIEQLEDEVFELATGVLEAGLRFGEVTREQSEPPPGWVEQYGVDEAYKRLELAKAMWLPQSVAPVGFKFAAQASIGISKARSYRVKLTQNNLNVKLTLPAPTTAEHPGSTVYEVRDLET